MGCGPPWREDSAFAIGPGRADFFVELRADTSITYASRYPRSSGRRTASARVSNHRPCTSTFLTGVHAAAKMAPQSRSLMPYSRFFLTDLQVHTPADPQH